MTRKQLIDRIARKQNLTRKTSGEIADLVLEVVAAEVRPVIENEWSGGEVMRRIRALKGTR